MDWGLIKQRLGEVVKNTALDSSDADFLVTHMPFKSLKFISSGLKESGSDELSEDDFFRKYLLDTRDQHNFIVVRGETGSGKSHLIRWLYYRYKNEVDPNEEIVAIITRGQNTLKGALQQIIESEMFAYMGDSVEVKKLIEASNNLNKDELREQIAALLAAKCNPDDEEGEKYLKKRIHRLVYSFLSDEIIREHILFKKDGPIDRIVSKLVMAESEQKEVKPRFFADDFSIEYGGEILRNMQSTKDRSSDRAIRLAEMLADEKNGPELRQSLADYLNSKINGVIQACIKIGKNDLIEIFNKVRTTLKEHNKSLALFIEDVTSFDGIDRELIEAIKINHNEEKNLNLCRITSVIGITNYYYDSSLPDNIKERITSQVVIEDKSLFASSEDVCEFVGRYINAVNIDNEKLNIWLRNGANDKELPIAEDNFQHKWALFKLKDGRTLSLYPFNRNAIWNIYNGLERKTPRFVIKIIMLNLYKDFMENPQQFPPPEKSFSGIEIPKWQDPLIENRLAKEVEGIEKERISALLRVWGEGHLYEDTLNGQILIGGVPDEVFKHFNLPVIRGIKRDKLTQSQTTEGEEHKYDEVESKNEFRQEANNKSLVSVHDSKILSRRKEYEKMMEDLENWKKGGKLANHKQLRDLFCDLVKNYFNWEEENISPLFVKQFFTINNFHIEGQNVELGSGFIMRRDPNLESFNVLLALINWRYKGEKSWDFPNSEEHVLNVTNYLNNHKNEIIEVIKHPNIKNPDKWDFEGWALLNEYYMRALNGELDLNMPLEEIYKKMFTTDLEIINKGEHGNIWNSLAARMAEDEDVETHHDNLIRYYNMILGEAKPGTTGTFYLDVYHILSNLEKLRAANWKIDKNIIDTIEEAGQTGYNKPLNLMKKYWLNKIDKLLEEEIDRTDRNLARLDQLLGEDYSSETIDLLNMSACRFLNEVLYDAKENYDEADFAPIINKKYSGEELRNYIDEIRKIKEQKNAVDALILLSKSHNSVIEEYINALNNLEKKVMEICGRFQNKLSVLESDEILKLENLSSEIKNILGDIKEAFTSIIEVDSCAGK